MSKDLVHGSADRDTAYTCSMQNCGTRRMRYFQENEGENYAVKKRRRFGRNTGRKNKFEKQEVTRQECKF